MDFIRLWRIILGCCGLWWIIVDYGEVLLTIVDYSGLLRFVVIFVIVVDYSRL